MEFRTLRADEIDVRVGSVSKTGATLLLYKNARVDMQVLDETVGQYNWQRDHKEIKGNLYCGIGINSGCEWVWKWDCGTESNTEAEKGEASDSFKRAGFNWGIGRELYTAPVVFIKCETEDTGRGYKLKDRYEFWDTKVSKIEYETVNGFRRISCLEITRKGKTIFTWHSDTPIVKAMEEGTKLYATVSEKEGLKQTWQRKGLTWKWLCDQLGWDETNGDISQADYGKAMNLLMGYPDAQRD